MGALQATDNQVPRPDSRLSGMRPGPSEISPDETKVQLHLEPDLLCDPKQVTLVAPSVKWHLGDLTGVF